jgi:hypothetical protein
MQRASPAGKADRVLTENLRCPGKTQAAESAPAKAVANLYEMVRQYDEALAPGGFAALEA